MGNKLTDNEIKKALECCAENSGCPINCPLKDMGYVGDCVQVKSKHALDLINRLEAENNELVYKLECLLCHATGSKLSKHTYPLDTIAVKEFAKRLKATFPDRQDSRCTLDDCYTLDIIDNLVKEMVGEA